MTIGAVVTNMTIAATTVAEEAPEADNRLRRHAVALGRCIAVVPSAAL